MLFRYLLFFFIFSVRWFWKVPSLTYFPKSVFWCPNIRVLIMRSGVDWELFSINFLSFFLLLFLYCLLSFSLPLTTHCCRKFWGSIFIILHTIQANIFCCFIVIFCPIYSSVVYLHLVLSKFWFRIFILSFYEKYQSLKKLKMSIFKDWWSSVLSIKLIYSGG